MGGGGPGTLERSWGEVWRGRLGCRNSCLMEFLGCIRASFGVMYAKS